MFKKKKNHFFGTKTILNFSVRSLDKKKFDNAMN